MSTPIRSRDAPWLVVLVLVAVFQVLRGAWPDVGVFCVAIALAVLQVLAPPRRRLTEQPPTPFLVVAAIVLGVVLMVAPRHGILAGIVVCGIGAAAVVVAVLGGWPTDAAGSTVAAAPAFPQRALRRAAAAWSLLIVVAGLWEATAYLTWKWGLLADGVMPAISDLVDPLLDTVVGKAVFIGVWLAGGVALLARAWPPTRTGAD